MIGVEECAGEVFVAVRKFISLDANITLVVRNDFPLEAESNVYFAHAGICWKPPTQHRMAGNSIVF